MLVAPSNQPFIDRISTGYISFGFRLTSCRHAGVCSTASFLQTMPLKQLRTYVYVTIIVYDESTNHLAEKSLTRYICERFFVCQNVDKDNLLALNLRPEDSSRRKTTSRKTVIAKYDDNNKNRTCKAFQLCECVKFRLKKEKIPSEI